MSLVDYSWQFANNLHAERWRDEGKINKYSHVKSFDGSTKSDSRARLKGTEGGVKLIF